MKLLKIIFGVVVVLIIVVVLAMCKDINGDGTKVHVISVYGTSGNLVEQYVTDSPLWTGNSYVTFKVDGKQIRVYGNFIVEEL